MNRLYQYLDNFGAILLAVIWVAPLLFAFWAAFHTTSDAVNFNLTSSWTLDNFRIAWGGCPLAEVLPQHVLFWSPWC